MSATSSTPEVRNLPTYSAGTVTMPNLIHGMDEQVAIDTSWPAHAHPTHELLWNRAGASTATIGARVWTITPSMGLWITVCVLHDSFARDGARRVRAEERD